MPRSSRQFLPRSRLGWGCVTLIAVYICLLGWATYQETYNPVPAPGLKKAVADAERLVLSFVAENGSFPDPDQFSRLWDSQGGTVYPLTFHEFREQHFLEGWDGDEMWRFCIETSEYIWWSRISW